MATVTRNNVVLEPGKTFGSIEECDGCGGITEPPRYLRFLHWEQPDMVAVVSESKRGHQPEFLISMCPDNRSGCDESISPNTRFASADEARRLWSKKSTRCIC